MKYLNLKQMTIAAMLGTSLLLTGCGGGGASVTPINDNPPADPVDPTLGTYLEGVDLTGGIADAGMNSGNYDEINVGGLKEAHDDGWTGLGTNILVWDVAADHATEVGLISAAVAPGSNTVVYDGTEFLSGDTTISSHDVDAANHSYGRHLDSSAGTNWFDKSDADQVIFADNWEATYDYALDLTSNAVIVFSAGNNGNTGDITYTDGTVETGGLCSTAGGRDTADSCTDIKFVYDRNLDVSRTIFVGATDGTNDNETDLAEYSVSAGSRAMNDFIVADGSGLTSGDGTSYAAPRVAGAVALVAHKFPNTEAEDRKLIILNTADDLGATGVDAVFGHGLLNVGAALSPVGNLR